MKETVKQNQSGATEKPNATSAATSRENEKPADRAAQTGGELAAAPLFGSFDGETLTMKRFVGTDEQKLSLRKFAEESLPIGLPPQIILLEESDIPPSLNGQVQFY